MNLQINMAKRWFVRYFGELVMSSKGSRSHHRYTKLNLSNGMETEETKSRVPSLLWIPLVVCVVLLYFLDVFQIHYYSTTPTPSSFADKFIDDKSLSGFSVNTPGCRIPDMDPFDEHIVKFIEKPKVPKCNKGIPALYKAKLASVELLNASLASYNVTDKTELKCCFRSFWRKDPTKKQSDNQIEFDKKCYSIGDYANITQEFIEVTCTYENVTIYKDMFAFVPLKQTTVVTTPIPKPLNVLIIGIDAVSRLNLHRQMPKTLNTLQDLGAVEFLGYNKVGDNTFPNLIPVLTGLVEGELRNSCWPKQTDHFDKCHFIWQDFKKKGYVTAYGEDAAWMGLFNYQRRGFQKQSTDYSYSYFSSISESKIGNSHNMNVMECEGARNVYKDFQAYVNKFVVTMDNNYLPYFAFFWGVTLSHDYLNQPKMGDEDYSNLITGFKDGGHLNNTALIFMSDHGIRWGGIRQTYQGRMEERLPFVITLLPDWYKRQYPTAYNNLRRNARRLTTPLDLHYTLIDLLNPFDMHGEFLEISDTKSRGISFFREISKYRTCEDAGIASHWCTCQTSEEIAANSSEATVAAEFAVQYINKELEGYAQCATLTLEAVLNARMMMHGKQINNGNNKIQDYMLTIRTVPGDAVFEVTVRFIPKSRRYDIMGTISRLNLYGKQSACITDFHLKLYCYCKSLLE